MNTKILTISRLAIFITILNIIFLMFCDQELKELVAPDEKDFPGAPKNVTVMVADHKIHLSWEMSSEQGIAGYHIYRKDTISAEINLIDSTLIRQYIDKNVKNGKIYYYEISAVNLKGYEGKRSDMVSARPNVFSIIIENGEEYTNKKSVTLKLTAPIGTKHMRIANDSLFTNSSWELYASTKNWSLSSGDGKKYVFVKFRDYEENETNVLIFDTIILDTKAVISQVTQNTNSQTKAPGQVIHFTVITGEVSGTATVDIGEQAKNIALYDDGSNGDTRANDGTYEVNYTIPSGVEVVNAIIIGHFTDRVGNVAQNVTAAGYVTIKQDPIAVTLYPPVQKGTDNKSLELYWSQSTESDFSSYRLYRKTAPGVDTSSTLITMITNIATTNFTDQDLNSNTDYYYRIFVFDHFGSSKGSNEVVGNIAVDTEKPTPVVLLPLTPVENSLTSLKLTWSKNQDDDFESYRIYRAEAPNDVDSTSLVVEIIYDQNQTNYEDTELEEDTEYNYQIFVFDTDGNSAGSNKEKGKTNANESPSPVTLLKPTAVEGSTTELDLTWSKNDDEDFASYRIYRTEAPQAVDSSSFMVKIINDQNTTNYRDTELEEDSEYNYRVYVFDDDGKSSGSNTETGKTNADDPPKPVTLLQPIAVENSTTSLSLTWSKNDDEDFASYRIFRSDAPQEVDSASFLVTILYSQELTSYEDKNLEEATEYNYRVYVYDEAGNSTGSNTVTGKTNENLPPESVTLAQPTVVDSTTLRLTWSQNDDQDFKNYQVYRSDSAGVDSASALITIISNRTTLNYTDLNLVKNKTYYYRVYVTDAGGLSTGSNEVSGTPKP